MEACGVARPDPDRLAEWLVGTVLDDRDDVTDLDPLDYAEVLGPGGLARMRQLTAEALRRRPSGWAERYL